MENIETKNKEEVEEIAEWPIELSKEHYDKKEMYEEFKKKVKKLQKKFDTVRKFVRPSEEINDKFSFGYFIKEFEDLDNKFKGVLVVPSHAKRFLNLFDKRMEQLKEKYEELEKNVEKCFEVHKELLKENLGLDLSSPDQKQKKEQADKELLELIKEAKNSDMTVGEFKKRIDDMEKRFGEENFDVKSNKDQYPRYFPTPERAFASFIFRHKSQGLDSVIVKSREFTPEIGFNNGEGYISLRNMSYASYEDAELLNNFLGLHNELPDVKQELRDKLSKMEKGYWIHTQGEWLSSLERDCDNKGHIFPGEVKYIEAYMSDYRKNLFGTAEETFGDTFKDRLLKYRLSKYESLKKDLLSEDKKFTGEELEEIKNKFLFFAENILESCITRKAKKPVALSIFKELDSMDLLSIGGRAELKDLEKDIKKDIEKANKSDTDCSFG